MIRIELERDLETLRQVASLLDAENQRLISKVTRLTAELAKAHGFDETYQRQLELSILKDLEQVRQRVFRADEKPPVPVERGSRKPAPGHGPRPQPRLPQIDVVHELKSEEKGCDVCGGELEEMSGQFEESEVVTVVKRQFVVEHHRRKKYRCRCNANVVTAPGPTKLMPGGRYSVEFAVEVATSKYADHLPLERQVQMMKREGLEIDSQTLWDQLNGLAHCLEPTYEALGQKVLKSPVINVDETRWPLLGSNRPSPGSVWTVRSPEVCFYRMLETKSIDDGRKVLGEYQGVVVADGYAVYPALQRAGPGFRLGHCWSHCKRHFEEIAEEFPSGCAEVVPLIRRLYEVERLVPGPFPGSEEAQRLRGQLRQERSRPILDEIYHWAVCQEGLPRSDFGKAVRYLLERWKGLTLFVDNPQIPIDNNAAERALRGPVVGRKNHYGSRSKRGTEVAALFYTLCETAKLHGLDPRDYLLQAACAAIERPGTVTLPDDVKRAAAADA